MAGVIAPTRALRDRINETIRDRLIAEGGVSGPTREVRKLVPRGLTHAEMTRSENCQAGDTVIFNRRYKTLGVEKGDRREVAEVDADTRTVYLRDDLGNVVDWKPSRIAAAKGGVELFRSESLELRSGDKVRFTRNDLASGLTKGQVAAVESVGKDGFGFVTDDPKRLADQLERATGERIAALDAVEERAVLADGKQGELTLETRKREASVAAVAQTPERDAKVGRTDRSEGRKARVAEWRRVDGKRILGPGDRGRSERTTC